jgi:hypothetical protein
MSAPGRRAASEVPGRQGLRTPLTAAFVPGGETKAATLDTTADCFMIQPAADIFVAIGPAPNAAVDPRMLIRGGEAVTIPCAKGDKVAWVLA